MEPAVFLITALADVKKESFGTRLQTLLDQQIPVRLIFASLDFGEREAFDRLLKTLIGNHQPNVKVANLYDIFSTVSGVTMSTDTPTITEPNADRQQRVSHSDGTYDVQYLQNEYLLATRRYFANDQLAEQQTYQDNQLIQRVFYGANAQIQAISNFNADGLKETLLLNGRGELVYRFVREQQTVQRLFNMDQSANLQLTNVETARPVSTRGKKGAEATNHLMVVDREETVYKVMDYVNFTPLSGVYDFYRQVLDQVNYQDQRLYINVDHNVAFSAMLPDQLIFNY
ncbi:hypothetical protein ACA590_16495 [Lactiplantibacillus plantarum]|uniref:hypothetical protein n=1 Tax=Lactiplantibacillus TaxID=2767842 RepID=UPI0030C75F33